MRGLWNAVVASASLYLLALAAGVAFRIHWLAVAGAAGDGLAALLVVVFAALWAVASITGRASR